jgi:hypothetical protein
MSRTLTPRYALLLGFTGIAALGAAWFGGRAAAAKHVDAPRVAQPAVPTAPPATEPRDDRPTPAAVPFSAPAPERPVAPAPQAQAPAPPSGEELVTRCDAQLATEDQDRSWAGPMAQKLAGGLRKVDGVDVRDVECRSSMCRVTLHYASGTRPRKVLDATCVGPQAEWASLNVGCFLAAPTTAGDGSSDGALYVFRDGHMPQ